MNLESRVKDQMVCFRRNPLPWFAVLAPFLISAGFLGFGFSSVLLTSTLLIILSTVYFTLSKSRGSSSQMEDFVSEPDQPESESMAEKKEGQDQYFVTSPDSLSESEGIYRLSTSEESDGSISDEESLIEIALPSGQYVGEKLKVNKQQQKVAADFSPESFFQPHCLMELLSDINEMNEEDNLIEIDISMGSIKCSRFEIEA
jgi:hypothetical protein